jgi:hypothetical protein
MITFAIMGKPHTKGRGHALEFNRVFFSTTFNNIRHHNQSSSTTFIITTTLGCY